MERFCGFIAEQKVSFDIKKVYFKTDKYRVKFLNCIRREARKLEKFRPYIINKKYTYAWAAIYLNLKMVRWRSERDCLND